MLGGSLLFLFRFSAISAHPNQHVCAKQRVCACHPRCHFRADSTRSVDDFRQRHIRQTQAGRRFHERTYVLDVAIQMVSWVAHLAYPFRIHVPTIHVGYKNARPIRKIFVS